MIAKFGESVVAACVDQLSDKIATGEIISKNHAITLRIFCENYKPQKGRPTESKIKRSGGMMAQLARVCGGNE